MGRRRGKKSKRKDSNSGGNPEHKHKRIKTASKNGNDDSPATPFTKWTETNFQILEDVVSKTVNENDPSIVMTNIDCTQNCKVWSERARQNFSVDLPSEKIRSKLRTVKGREFLKTIGRPLIEKIRKTRKNNESTESEDYSEDDDEDDNEDDDEDSSDTGSSEESSNEEDARVQKMEPTTLLVNSSPHFWKLNLADGTVLRLLNRELGIEVKHKPGKDKVYVIYTLTPPTPLEVEVEIIKKKDEVVGYYPNINVHDPLINEQIKKWEPIKWEVLMKVSPPLLPFPYHAGKVGAYSWVKFDVEPKDGTSTQIGATKVEDMNLVDETLRRNNQDPPQSQIPQSGAGANTVTRTSSS